MTSAVPESAPASLVHATARLVRCTAQAALRHLSTAAGMARWTLGMTNCRESGEPGLFVGESLHDGSTGLVRVRVDAGGGLVDYAVGARADALVSRIRATVQPGPALGHAEDLCMVTLLAWRIAGMDDARWRRLINAHEAEMDLVQAQLQTTRSGMDHRHE